MQLALCNFRGKLLGSHVNAVARTIPVSEETAARNALSSKSGWKYKIGDFLSRLIGQKRRFIEISTEGV